MSVATEITRLKTAKADIKTAIEEKGVTVGDGTIDTYAEKITEISSGGQGSYDEGYEAGRLAYIDSLTGFYYFFANDQNTELWDDIKKHKDFTGVSTIQYMFINNTKLESFEFLETMRYQTALHGLFQGCTNLKTVSGFEKSGGVALTGIFDGCSSLYNAGTINFENVVVASRAFYACSALKEIRIVGTIKILLDFKDSTLLSKESITSIVNALSQTTSGLTITVSKTAVNNAFNINVDDPTTYPEGSEYYTLRNSKSNWTFNYA